MTKERIEFLLKTLLKRYECFLNKKLEIYFDDSDNEREEKNKNLREIKKYFPANEAQLADISLDLIKVWLLLLQKDYDNNIPKILAYLESVKYGWVNGEYKSTNNCSWNCRRRGDLATYDKYDKLDVDEITDVEQTKSYFHMINSVFFDSEYGRITLIIFSYCLAGLFRSKLTRSTSPLYLQIACGKNTLLHELISEIVTICDVNTGIYKKCQNTSRWSCGYDRHKTIYPVNVDRIMDDLLSFKDVPIVVDGYGNSRNYHALLREVANKSNKREHFDTSNVLPIFICPEIKLDFSNVFNMDLTNVQVSDEYLKLIRRTKTSLMSLVFDVINDFIPCLFPGENIEDSRKKYIENEYPFAEKITNSIQIMRGKRATTEKNAQNAGILNFFFMGFIRAFERLFNPKKFDDYTRFAYSDEARYQNKVNHIAKLIEKAEKSLIETHKNFSPAPIDSLLVYMEEDLSKKEINQKEKKARNFAMAIVRCYQSFGTSLSITKITVKGDR